MDIALWQGTTINPCEVPGQKTPVSLLQEICNKKGIIPEYELVALEGRVHQPLYAFRCFPSSNEQFNEIGQGRSKKAAKHFAAHGVLKKIIQSGRHVDWKIPGRTGDEALAYEMCNRNRWPPPDFVMDEKDDNAGEKLFSCTVKIGKFIETAFARTKRLAKRNACEQMLTKLLSVPKEDLIIDEEEIDKLGPYPSDIDAELALSSMITGNKPSLMSDITLSVIDRIKRTDFQELPPSNDSRNLLEQISLEHEKLGGLPVYHMIKHHNTRGEYQCLVQLTTLPVAVMHGTGRTEEDAQNAAAHNALEYIKLMVL